MQQGHQQGPSASQAVQAPTFQQQQQPHPHAMPQQQQLYRPPQPVRPQVAPARPAHPTLQSSSAMRPTYMPQAVPRPAAAAATRPNSFMGTYKPGESLPAQKRIKKRKGPDSASIDRAGLELPESVLYTAALDMDRQLDAKLAQHRTHVAVMAGSAKKTQKTLRVFLQSRHHNIAPGPPGHTSGPPSWEFEVSGRLIERAESEGTAAAPIVPAPLPGSAAALGGQQSSLGPRFSSLIRRLTIRLDPEQYPADGVITWSKALHEGPAKDRFSVRRRGKQEVRVTVEVEAEGEKEQHELTRPLAELLGITHESRAGTLQALFTYIRLHKLQLPSQANMVKCDEALNAIFGEKMVTMSSLSTRIAPLLQPCPRPLLEYTIQVHGKAKRQVYDIEVEISPYKPSEEQNPVFENVAQTAEIAALDQKVAGLVRRVQDASRRRNSLLAFSQSPVDFINALIASQAKELRQLGNPSDPSNPHAPQVMQRSELFQGRWVEDAVWRYLSRTVGFNPQ
ncbi:hypothetical protein CVIRNUC_005145 [Coccomyxa viridis]|uniref:DM2 domain-containing protein n=1 Tax=Coccomyxa viridis TaxID=1274662 RepID=A0AAV1I4Q1_9CHLO|nr:hypothetical protein CVIRNUC_005145 [Coccomyxa viridis]